MFPFGGKGTTSHPVSKARNLGHILGTSLSLPSHRPYLIHHHSLPSTSTPRAPPPPQSSDSSPGFLHHLCPSSPSRLFPTQHPGGSFQHRSHHIILLFKPFCGSCCQEKDLNLEQTTEAASAGSLPDSYTPALQYHS